MNLDATFYLALSESQRHPYLSARIATKRPSLKAGEVLLELNVSVPRALFKRPSLSASIKVPDNMPSPVITTEVQDGIAAVLSQQLGMRVTVTAEAGQND